MRAEPIVPHPLEATRQDMQEQAPEEFNRVERHEALAIPSLVILPPEGPLAIGTGQEPPIRNGYAMRVAGQVAEDSLRPGQWRLGIDHPLRLLQGREELAPGWGRLPALALPLQAEALLDGRLLQRGQEGTSKEATEDAYREEETFGTREPGGTVQGQAPCRDEAMEMGMMTTTLTIP